MGERVITFRPKTANCTEYKEDDKSGTLCTKYHYGGGGDAALILEEKKLIVLNDQGGSVMDVSNEVTATLRAQEHGHPPVVCFEPGIAKREGNTSRFIHDICGTLRADMGDNQPAVCYATEIETERTHEQNENDDLLYKAEHLHICEGRGGKCFEMP